MPFKTRRGIISLSTCRAFAHVVKYKKLFGKEDMILELERFDAVVIGGGILGCFVARELCRWKLKTVLIEAREDVCTGISRANTAIVYPGYDHKPGTLKAEMTVHANAEFEMLCRELDVPFSRCGSMMLSFGQKANTILQKKYLQGMENRVPALRLITGEEAREREPSLSPDVRLALYSPTAGTVNPWQLGIAACENARQNGVELRLNTKVIGICADAGVYRIQTEQEEFYSRSVVNCAGLAADRVHALLFPPEVRLVPTAGDYLLLDKEANKPSHILQYEPETKGKGLTMVPTTEGSLLIGPTERENSLDFSTSEEGLGLVRTLAKKLIPNLNLEDTIRSFAAVRPIPQYADGRRINSFVVEHPAPGFWSLIGIRTPGMTCAHELGLHIAGQLSFELSAQPNPAFDPVRKGIPCVHGLPFEQRKQLAKESPDFGEVVCICEDVTKGEILEAIRRGAITVDGVKRRVHTGMGRCQGARCQQRIVELLSNAQQIPEYAITKDGIGSEILRINHENL